MIHTWSHREADKSEFIFHSVITRPVTGTIRIGTGKYCFTVCKCCKCVIPCSIFRIYHLILVNHIKCPVQCLHRCIRLKVIVVHSILIFSDKLSAIGDNGCRIQGTAEVGHCILVNHTVIVGIFLYLLAEFFKLIPGPLFVSLKLIDGFRVNSCFLKQSLVKVNACGCLMRNGSHSVYFSVSGCHKLCNGTFPLGI